MPQDGKKTTLVDLVYSEREDSLLSPLLSELLTYLSLPSLRPSSEFLLDSISIRWALRDVLLGSGMDETTIAKIDAEPNIVAMMGVPS